MKLTQNKLVSWCDQVIAWSVYVVLVMTPAWFAFWIENFNLFELNKLLIFKTAVSLAWLAMLVKICLTKRIKVAFNRKIFLPLTILIAYIIVNTLCSIHPSVSFFGYYIRQQGIFSLIYYWLWFVLLLFFWRDRRQERRCLMAISLGLAVVLIYSFIQRLNLDPLKWSEPGSNRTFANLGQPNFLAYYLDLTFFLTMAGFVYWRKTWQKILLVLSLLAQFAVLIFTKSRGGMLGVAVGVLILVGFKLWRRGYKKTVITLVCLCLCSVVASHFVIKPLVEKKYLTNQTMINYLSAFSITNGSSQSRVLYWQAIADNFKAATWPRRLFGYGKDSQREIYTQYYRPNWAVYEKINSYPDRAHNLLLDIWLEFGLIGLCLFGWLAGLAIVRAIKANGDEALVACLLAAVGAYFFSNLFGFPLTTHYVYYYFILAWLWRLGNSDQTTIVTLKFSKLFLWLITCSVTVFGAFFLWQFLYKYYIADIYFMRAKVGEANMDCQTAINNVNQAVHWQPLDRYFQEKFIFLYNNCLPIIEPGVKQKEVMNNLLNQLAVIDDSNDSYDLVLNIAHSYSLFGFYFDKKYYARGDEFYQKLIAMNPYILSSYQDYGRMKMWQGDFPAAKRIFQQGLAASPEHAVGYADGGYGTLINSQTDYLRQLIGDCDYHQRRFAEALVMYRQAEDDHQVSLELYKNMADSYVQLKDYGRAEQYLQKAVSAMPNDADINVRLAGFYLARGQKASAKRYATAGLKIAPNNQEAQRILTILKQQPKKK